MTQELVSETGYRSSAGGPALDRSKKRLARTWDGRVKSWHEHAEHSPGMSRVHRETLAACGDVSGLDVVDLGAGSGAITVPLAMTARQVIAVDLSSRMLADLQQGLETGLGNVQNVTTHCMDIATFDLPPRSVDLVVSCYAMHHLNDAEKAAAIRHAAAWLRPGGRIVLADMMLGRGLGARDRKIIASKVRLLARKGVGGWWRIAKNAVRLSLRTGTEKPCSPGYWSHLLASSGFTDVAVSEVVAEAAVVTGRRPPT